MLELRQDEGMMGESGKLEDRVHVIETKRSDDRFGRLERKLDQFIDVQVRTNDLVERRLRALESPDA
jgi:hypothetical protein